MSINRRIKKIIIVAILLIVSSIAIYEGHFLFRSDAEPENQAQPQSNKREQVRFEYKHVTTSVNDHLQEINILEFDPRDERVKLKPVLSGDNVFGFEKLSSMAARTHAHAAVNAGFFHRYGEPSGIVVIDGEIVSTGTGRYPVFSLDAQQASLKEMKMAIWLTDGVQKFEIDTVNRAAAAGKTSLFNRYYGTDNRVLEGNLSIIIDNGVVANIVKSSGETAIPQNGMVVTILDSKSHDTPDIPFKVGDAVTLVSDLYQDHDTQAYECGSWIVKDGQIVIDVVDPWIGVTTNRDPRTVLGIKNDGKVLLMTVDGRQPGYSAGLTCRELGQVLLDMGVDNAAMLDGGASTVMIVEDKIVNKPSFKGLERPLGGGLVLELTRDD